MPTHTHTLTTMSSNYIVYVPYGPEASAHPIAVPNDALVKGLALSIHNDPDLKHYLEDKPLSLFNVRYCKSFASC